MPLFGRRTGVKLAVEPQTVTAGEEIVCRVDVGEIDPKVQGGRVEFGYENFYVEREMDPDGQAYKTAVSAWVLAQTAPLFGGVPTRGGHVVRLRVPEDAPPTVAYAVEWQVLAIVDRRGGRDARAKVPVVVNAAPEVLAGRTHTPAASSTGVPMTVELATREVRRGGTLSGTVTADPAVEVPDVNELRVQLVCERREQDGIVERSVEAEVPLVEEVELRPGQRISVPFVIAIPTDVEPCFQARYNAQHWYLEAVVDIPLGADEVTRVELLVT